MNSSNNFGSHAKLALHSFSRSDMSCLGLNHFGVGIIFSQMRLLTAFVVLSSTVLSAHGADDDKKSPPPFFLQDPADSLCLAGEEFKRCSLDTLFYVVGSPGKREYALYYFTTMISLKFPSTFKLQENIRFTSEQQMELLMKKMTVFVSPRSLVRRETVPNLWKPKLPSALIVAPKIGTFWETPTLVMSLQRVMGKLVLSGKREETRLSQLPATPKKLPTPHCNYNSPRLETSKP